MTNPGLPLTMTERLLLPLLVASCLMTALWHRCSTTDLHGDAGGCLCLSIFRCIIIHVCDIAGNLHRLSWDCLESFIRVSSGVGATSAVIASRAVEVGITTDSDSTCVRCTMHRSAYETVIEYLNIGDEDDDIDESHEDAI